LSFLVSYGVIASATIFFRRHLFVTLAKLIKNSVGGGLILISLSIASGVQAATITVAGTSDPWLAGMPDGSTASFGAVAPTHSPVQVSGLSLIPGQTLNFSASGGVSHNPLTSLNDPDGGSFFSHLSGSENGISDITAPLNSLLGVFLDNSQPDLTLAPGSLNFYSIGLNFSSLAPQVKQVFFIGDGLTGTNSGAVQNFIVPTNATRLFLGTMDIFEWNNNIGSFSVTVQAVPEPSTIFGLGVLGFGAFFKHNLAKSKKSNQQDKQTS
jgi:hypothetical protein